jgi:hypothetical protein
MGDNTATMAVGNAASLSCEFKKLGVRADLSGLKIMFLLSVGTNFEVAEPTWQCKLLGTE